MLNIDPDKRIKVDEALAHPWITGEQTKTNLLNATVESLTARKSFRKSTFCSNDLKRKSQNMFPMLDSANLKKILTIDGDAKEESKANLTGDKTLASQAANDPRESKLGGLIMMSNQITEEEQHYEQSSESSHDHDYSDEDDKAT